MNGKRQVATTPFGKFVRKRLVDLEWTLEDLAKHSEISRTQLSRIFSGKLQITHDIVKTLEEVLVPFTYAEHVEFEELAWGSLPSLTIDISKLPCAKRRLAFRLSRLLDLMTQDETERIGRILDSMIGGVDCEEENKLTDK